jgi:hypothetical protein
MLLRLGWDKINQGSFEGCRFSLKLDTPHTKLKELSSNLDLSLDHCYNRLTLDPVLDCLTILSIHKQ